MVLTENKILKLSSYELPSFSKFDYNFGIEELKKCLNLFCVVVYDYEHNSQYSRDIIKEKVHSYIKNSIRNVFNNKDKNPSFANGHCWGYGPFAASLAIIKKSENLWSLFNYDDHNKMDFAMKMFALMWNFGCNDKNNFETGINLNGNFEKTWSPNYKLTNNLMYLYCLSYLGDGYDMEKIDSFFNSITYTEVIQKLREFEWENTLFNWSKEGLSLYDGSISSSSRDLFGTPNNEILKTAYYLKKENNLKNLIYGGEGVGCCTPYLYNEHSASNSDFPAYLYEDIILDTFSGGPVKSSFVILDGDYTCKIKDNLISPYENQEGMMFEFNKEDSYGFRSSTFHCEIDFYLIACLIKSLDCLFDISFNNISSHDLILVGMNDFLYKKQNEYSGFCLGRPEYQNRTFEDLYYWFDLWNDETFFIRG